LAHGKILDDLECFESGETITPIGLPSVPNRELLFELDDVMAGIGIECKKNLPDGTIPQ
jgi:hypothetical protein